MSDSEPAGKPSKGMSLLTLIAITVGIALVPLIRETIPDWVTGILALVMGIVLVIALVSAFLRKLRQ